MIIGLELYVGTDLLVAAVVKYFSLLCCDVFQQVALAVLQQIEAAHVAQPHADLPVQGVHFPPALCKTFAENVLPGFRLAAHKEQLGGRGTATHPYAPDGELHFRVQGGAVNAQVHAGHQALQGQGELSVFAHPDVVQHGGHGDARRVFIRIGHVVAVGLGLRQGAAGEFIAQVGRRQDGVGHVLHQARMVGDHPVLRFQLPGRDIHFLL